MTGASESIEEKVERLTIERAELIGYWVDETNLPDWFPETMSPAEFNASSRETLAWELCAAEARGQVLGVPTPEIDQIRALIADNTMQVLKQYFGGRP